MIPMISPTKESSQISSTGYDPVQKVLRVQFKSNGAIYDYQNVEQADVDAIRGAESIGKEFNSRIKAHPSKYPYQKV